MGDHWVTREIQSAFLPTFSGRSAAIHLLLFRFCDPPSFFNPPCLSVWIRPQYRETVSTSSRSNEVHVQLRCSCLLCCERHPVIDVIPWSFFTAASNIRLFMRVCFHLLCARICVRMCVCKYGLCKYICTFMCVCTSLQVCVLVCVSTYPDYQSSDVCLSDHWGCLLWLHWFSASACSTKRRKNEQRALSMRQLVCA